MGILEVTRASCVTNWVTNRLQVWPFVAFYGRARLAMSLNLIREQSRRVFYESAALPTELRRPVFDFKWECGKRKGTAENDGVLYAARATTKASYSSSDSRGSKTHMV